MVGALGIEPKPQVFQTRVRTSKYTKPPQKLVVSVGFKPTISGFGNLGSIQLDYDTLKWHPRQDSNLHFHFHYALDG